MTFRSQDRTRGITGGRYFPRSSLWWGLVHYWGLEEDGLALRRDYIGSPFLIPSLSISAVTGKNGNGASFPGNSTIYLYSDQSPIDLSSSSYSWSTWIKLTALGSQNNIASKQNSTPDREWSLAINASNKVIVTVFYNNGASNVNIASAAAIADTNWHQVGFLWDLPSLTPSVILDGVITAGSAAPSAPTANTAAQFRVGQVQFAGAGPFNGGMDEVGVWNRVLSPAEASVLATGTGLAGSFFPF